MAQNYDSTDSFVLEGIYKSIANNVGQVQQSVSNAQEAMSKELQYNSAQQMSAYEALVDSIEHGVESVLAELRYVAQQNSTIYDYNQIGLDKLKEDVQGLVKSEQEAVQKQAAESLTEMMEAFEKRQEERIQKLRADMLAAIRGLGPRTEGEGYTTDVLDGYDVHSEIEEVRVLAEETRDLLSAVREEINARPAVEETQTEERAEAAEEQPAVEQRAIVRESDGDTEYGELDYDVLAEKIVSVLPETDYDLIADKVAAAIPQTDAEAVADRVAASIGQLDENAIADKVAEAIPMVDYDLIAERVVAALEGDTTEGEETLTREEKLAKAIAEKLDYDRIAEQVSLSLENDEIGAAEAEEDDGVSQEEKIAAAVEEKLDYERIAERVAELLNGNVNVFVAAPVREEEEEVAAAVQPAPEPEPEPEPEPAPVVVVAPAPKKKEKPAPVVVPVKEEEEETVVRYKYSFTAKIAISDMDTKEYYSRLKNAFMSYPNTSSQINWANDRFSYDNETIAKVAVRGKTLCLYLALDPAELPESVYHQTFAGDTKMYEKTPTMVKIKSGVALKRALRLIELLMEKNGAVQEEPKKIDYTAQFPYRSEEELLHEGLVKAVLIGKSESDFVRK